MRYPAPIPPILNYARPHTVPSRRQSIVARAWLRFGPPMLYIALTYFTILVISIHLALVSVGAFAIRRARPRLTRFAATRGGALLRFD